MATVPSEQQGAQTRLGRVFTEPPIFERGAPGRSGASLPDTGVPPCDPAQVLPAHLLRATPPGLPEVSEPEVVRHYTRLSQLNHSVDTGLYPLGSCTMKYNPRINEQVAGLAGFADAHPLQPVSTLQGSLELMYELERTLAEISGFARVTLQPAAGAHGELTGLMMIRRALEERGDPRCLVLVPESAHGTNPASAALNGFGIAKVPCGPDGLCNVDALKEMLDSSVAAVMLTNPSTVGLFEEQVAEIAAAAHAVGAFFYCDGANLNAVLGHSRPGDWGVDVMQFNLHKTFSTPHGGGGPGAGPVGVSAALEPFLPTPLVVQRGDSSFDLDWDRPLSIGRVRSFYGNFGVMVRAYAYLLELGSAGLTRVSELAVLNARYLQHLVQDTFPSFFGRDCMHEFIINDDVLKAHGVKTLDIAKRLLDYGYHAPTVYFPLVVPGAMMIEPTETEPPEELERFASALKSIAAEASSTPELVTGAPHLTPWGRLDEALAARKPVLRWSPPGE